MTMEGLADAFQSAYEAAGGTVTINAPHEEEKLIIRQKLLLWRPLVETGSLSQVMSIRAAELLFKPHWIRCV